MHACFVVCRPCWLDIDFRFTNFIVAITNFAHNRFSLSPFRPLLLRSLDTGIGCYSAAGCASTKSDASLAHFLIPRAAVLPYCIRKVTTDRLLQFP